MSETPNPWAPLRIGHVRGVVLHKWQRTWEERFRNPLVITEIPDAEQLMALHAGEVDMCFVRLPIDRDGLHLIPLYEEQLVAWVEKEHIFSAVDSVTMADVEAEETVLTELAPTAIDRVLAGAVLVVPMSIARGASRKDLVYRPIIDAPTAPVGLAWRRDDENPLLDEFVGVVRGRSANSSRTQAERKASGKSAIATRKPGSRAKTPAKPRRTRRNKK